MKFHWYLTLRVRQILYRVFSSCHSVSKSQWKISLCLCYGKLWSVSSQLSYPYVVRISTCMFPRSFNFPLFHGVCSLAPTGNNFRRVYWSPSLFIVSVTLVARFLVSHLWNALIYTKFVRIVIPISVSIHYFSIFLHFARN